MTKQLARTLGWRAAVAALLLGINTPASGFTLRVPSEYPTITSAMLVAAAGDTVLVAPGVYDQHETRTGSLGIGYVRTATAVVFMADGAILLSEAGRNHTTIRFDSPGYVFDAAILAGGFTESGTTIDGFEITGMTPDTQGIWAAESEDLTVRNCRFVDLGVDREHAAGISVNRSSLVVTNCEFLRCTLIEDIPFGAAIEVIDDDIEIEGCLFEDCVGGAVLADGFSPWGGQYGRVANCVFRNNVGQALLVHERPEFYIEDNLFIGNSNDGPAAAINVSDPATNAYVRRNLFVQNSSTDPVNGGGVLFWNRPRGELANNTFFGNTGTSSGSACSIRADPFLYIYNNIFAECSGGVAISLFLYTGQPAGGCNVFWDNADGNTFNYILKDTDVEADPLFCDSPGGDFTVSGNSPCVPPGSGPCGQIGVYGQGCGTISVESESWGSVKERYRGTVREGESP